MPTLFTIVLDASGNGTETATNTTNGVTFRFPITSLHIVGSQASYTSPTLQTIAGDTYQVMESGTITLPGNGAAGPKSVRITRQIDRIKNPCTQTYNGTFTGS